MFFEALSNIALCEICGWQYFLHLFAKHTNCAKQSPRSIRKILSVVFCEVSMANVDKCHLLITTCKTAVDIGISNVTVLNEKESTTESKPWW